MKKISFEDDINFFDKKELVNNMFTGLSVFTDCIKNFKQNNIKYDIFFPQLNKGIIFNNKLKIKNENVFIIQNYSNKNQFELLSEIIILIFK